MTLDMAQERLSTPDLPEHLVLFDCECVLCSGSAQWIARHDPAGKFHFATAQSPLGSALFMAHGLSTDCYDSNLVLIKGRAHTRMGTVIAVVRAIGWPWKAASVLGLLPARWQDGLYDLIARNRYRLFGRQDRCVVASQDFRGRLID